MLRTTEIHKLAMKVTPADLKDRLPDDAKRLTQNFYGHCFRPDSYSSLVVLAGLRSGIDAIYLLERQQKVELLVLECDKNIRESFERMAGTIKIGHPESKIALVATTGALLDSIDHRQIDLLRVDEQYSTEELLRRLTIDSCVKQVVGEFSADRIDPLHLYRLSRNSTRQFLWRSRDLRLPISGAASTHPFEVSVVVPCYKVLPWVDRCIESLAEQTLKSLEIIAVDDGSPDKTGERLDYWAEKYPGRVKVIHKANGGCASARNAGLAAANGEFVTFVDADDWVDTTMFENLYRAAILGSADVAQCGFAEVYEGSERIDYHSTAWGGDGYNGESGVTRDILSYLTVKPSIWRRIYRRSFLSSNGIEFNDSLRRFDDLPFQFEVFSKLEKMAILPDCYYFYRQEREGQDVAVRDDRLFVHFPIFSMLNERVLSWADSNIEKALIKCKINTHRWALSRIEKKLRSLYFRHAAHDTVGSLCHLNRVDLLLLSSKLGPRSLIFIIKCLLWSFFPRPKMIPIR